MTTVPDELPPLSGLLAPLVDVALLVDEAPVVEELLEQAVTAARPTTASAAIPLAAVILNVI
jgi:hypothetical protein